MPAFNSQDRDFTSSVPRNGADLLELRVTRTVLESIHL